MPTRVNVSALRSELTKIQDRFREVQKARGRLQHKVDKTKGIGKQTIGPTVPKLRKFIERLDRYVTRLEKEHQRSNQ